MHVLAVAKRSCRGARSPRRALEMDQDYERRLLRQINHQNLPAEPRLAKVSDGALQLLRGPGLCSSRCSTGV